VKECVFDDDADDDDDIDEDWEWDESETAATFIFTPFMTIFGVSPLFSSFSAVAFITASAISSVVSFDSSGSVVVSLASFDFLPIVHILVCLL